MIIPSFIIYNCFIRLKLMKFRDHEDIFIFYQFIMDLPIHLQSSWSLLHILNLITFSQGKRSFI